MNECILIQNQLELKDVFQDGLLIACKKIFETTKINP